MHSKFIDVTGSFWVVRLENTGSLVESLELASWKLVSEFCDQAL